MFKFSMLVLASLLAASPVLADVTVINNGNGESFDQAVDRLPNMTPQRKQRILEAYAAGKQQEACEATSQVPCPRRARDGYYRRMQNNGAANSLGYLAGSGAGFND
ncbi:MAG: hypothetical protein JWM96_1240 [Alphaproteobacteria bacterium]|nr:hypothetical protein [Alphaproteobacteria bacterium]